MENQPQVAVGFLRGTGAAINVSLGWIPDHVKVVNLTDGDDYWENWLAKVIAFTSGGTTEIKAGDTLKGNTSGAEAVIQQVIVDTGTWAAGTAAGWLILRPGTHGSTAFGSETAHRSGVDADGTDAITVAVADQDGIDIDTEVAGTTTAATNISEYQGSAGSAGVGFTVGATISEDAKLLGYVAVRGFPGITNSASA